MTTPTPSPPRGRFIVLEGIDGSGKTTQLGRLAAWLPTSGLMPSGALVVTSSTPGGTALGQRLRELLLAPPDDAAPCATAELLLYVAATAQLVAEVMGPALAAGHWVLCDRYIGSTVAYQGYGRGHSLEEIEQLNRLATSGLVPDLTLWFDLPLADSLQRRSHRSADRIEAAGEAFLGRVAFGYDCLFVEATAWHRVDARASAPATLVAEECQVALLATFSANANP